MNGSANVNSLEALHEWHAALCVFRTEALESMSSIVMEINRADSWLDDQLRGWQREQRDAEEEVLRCKNELQNRKFVGFDGRVPDCSVQEGNLRQAKDRLDHAREQTVKVRQWYHKMPKMIDEEYQPGARHLVNFLEAELPRALAMLNAQIDSLQAYLNLRVEPAAPPAKPV